MVEALRVVLGLVVVASLATVVAFVLVFLAVVAWTLFTGLLRDPPVDELDQVLAEILRDKPATKIKPSGHRRFATS